MAKPKLVKDVMSRKVVTTETTESTFDAARKIMDHDIGCVVVMDKNKIAGMITKGDILRESVMKKFDSQKIAAGKIMSKPVVATNPNATLEQASHIMSEQNISKLPVIDENGKLVGIVTSTDMMRKGRPRVVSSKDVI